MSAPDALGLEVQTSVNCDVFRTELGSSGRADSIHAFLGNSSLVIFPWHNNIKLAKSDQTLQQSFLTPTLVFQNHCK